jgi:hypothetical protein
MVATTRDQNHSEGRTRENATTADAAKPPSGYVYLIANFVIQFPHP